MPTVPDEWVRALPENSTSIVQVRDFRAMLFVYAQRVANGRGCSTSLWPVMFGYGIINGTVDENKIK